MDTTRREQVATALDAVVSSVSNALLALVVVRSSSVDAVADFALIYGLIQIAVSAYRFIVGDGLLVTASRTGSVPPSGWSERLFLLVPPVLLVVIAASPLASDRSAWLAGAGGVVVAVGVDIVRYRLLAASAAVRALIIDVVWLAALVAGLVVLRASALGVTDMLVLWGATGALALLVGIVFGRTVVTAGSVGTRAWPARTMLTDFALASLVGYSIPAAGALLGESAITAAWQVSLSLFAPMGVLISAGRLLWLPRMAAQLAEGDRPWVLRLGLSASAFFGATASLVALAVWVLPARLLEAVLGDNWSTYRPLVVIFAIGHGFRLATVPIVDILRMSGHYILQVRTRGMHLSLLVLGLIASASFEAEVTAGVVTATFALAWALWVLGTREVPWASTPMAAIRGGGALQLWAGMLTVMVVALMLLQPVVVVSAAVLLSIGAMGRRAVDAADAAPVATNDLRTVLQPVVAVPVGVGIGAVVAFGTGLSASLTDALGPDAFRYEEQAVALEDGSALDVVDTGKELVPVLWSGLLRIGVDGRLVPALLSLLAGLAAAVSLRRTTHIAFDRRQGDVALAITLLSPAYLVFVAQPLREGAVALGAAWTLRGMVLILRSHRFRDGARWLFPGVAVVAFSRPIVLVVLLAAYLAVATVGVLVDGFQTRFVRRAVPIALLAFGVLVFRPAGLDLVAQLTWDQANDYREQVASTADSALIETSQIDGWAAALREGASGGVRLLTRPLVFDVRRPVDLVAALDTVMFLAVLTAAIRFGRRRLHDPVVWLFALAAAGMFGVGAIAAVDVGLLLRLRGLVSFFLAPLAAGLLSVNREPGRPDAARRPARSRPGPPAADVAPDAPPDRASRSVSTPPGVGSR